MPGIRSVENELLASLIRRMIADSKNTDLTENLLALKALIKDGAQINEILIDGQTPLRAAAYKAGSLNIELLKALKANGAKLEKTTKAEDIPLTTLEEAHPNKNLIKEINKEILAIEKKITILQQRVARRKTTGKPENIKDGIEKDRANEFEQREQQAALEKIKKQILSSPKKLSASKEAAIRQKLSSPELLLKQKFPLLERFKDMKRGTIETTTAMSKNIRETVNKLRKK